MAEHDPKKTADALEGLDESKRETLNRLITGTGFVAPIVASFAMQGISIRPAHAAPGSSSNMSVSDRRLKKNIVRIGTHENGCGIYRFSYLWTDAVHTGAIAQDVLDHMPEAVSIGPGNYLAVDYDMLGMTMRHQEIRAV
jgi:hypothetical protein